jgi:hypothetical protein
VDRSRGCAEAIPRQLESLAALEPGWLDGDGPAYDRDQLARLSEWLDGVVQGHELPTPYIYPTPEGYVRAEWSGVQWEVSVTFALAAREARLFAAKVDSDEFVERLVWLDKAGADDQLGWFLHAHAGSDVITTSKP